MICQAFSDLSDCVRGILMLTWISLGIIYTLPGPTLLFLACQTEGTISKFIPLLFTRSLGSLIGAFAARVVIRHTNCLSMVFCGLIITSAAVSWIPFVPFHSFKLMGAVLFFVGLGFGTSWEASNSIIRYPKWKGLNLKSFFYGIGAVTAPIFVEEFVDESAGISSNLVLRSEQNNGLENVTTQTCPLHAAQLTGIFLTGSIPLYLLVIVTLGALLRRIPVANTKNQEKCEMMQDSKVASYLYYILCTASNCIETGVESTFTIVVLLYSIMCQVDFSTSLLINIGFWISYCVGCCLVPVLTMTSKFVNTLLFPSLVKIFGMLLGAIIISIYSKMYLLLFGAILVGLFLPNIGETMISKSSNDSMWMENRFGLSLFSVYVMEALAPYVTIVAILTLGHHSFPSAILVLSCLLIVLYIVLIVLSRKKRDPLLIEYEGIEPEFQYERKKIREKMRSEVNELLGEPWDELSYYTSDDDVVFDKKEARNV